MQSADKRKLVQLKTFMDEQAAKELISITKKYDSYAKKYQDRVNELLKSVNYKLVLGHSFLPNETETK